MQTQRNPSPRLENGRSESATPQIERMTIGDAKNGDIPNAEYNGHSELTEQIPVPRDTLNPSTYSVDGPADARQSPSETRDTLSLGLVRTETEGTDTGINDGEDAERNGTANSSRAKKSSSKNEGQHTDKRYLCYICNKLFTRRRSVRDHIAKIHSVKQWEPSKSLEIIVDPITGEPTEEVQRQLYTVAARPLGSLQEMEEENEATERNADNIGMQTIQVVEGAKPQPPAPAEELVPSIEALATPVKIESPAPKSPGPSMIKVGTPAPLIGKKRPAPPSGGSAAKTKKGIAKPKPLHKKPKLISSEDSIEIKLLSSPSANPLSAQKDIKPKAKKISHDSPTPREPSPSGSADDFEEDEDDAEDEFEAPYSAADTPQTANSDGEVYCICRKGDNHSWMIACDGGCDEWFHGKCVDIRERDGDLIDKYICPRCQAKGIGQTTWKRMCRRKECRKPARVLEIPPSKYCSIECGRRFFVELIQRGDNSTMAGKSGQFVSDKPKEEKKRRKHRPVDSTPERTAITNGDRGLPARPVTPQSEMANSEYETDSSANDDVLPNRGGALRAGELKSIVNGRKSIDEWRTLGRKPLTPPTDTITNGDNVLTDTHMSGADIPYDNFESHRLVELQTQIAKHEQQASDLESREKFLSIVRERSTKITEEVRKTNPKQKDLCGYDPRLSWTVTEFTQWRDTSEDGHAILAGEAKLGPAPTSMTADKKPKRNGIVPNHHDVNGEDDQEGDASSDEDGATIMPTRSGVCVKNRCARHGKWFKMQVAEIRFEQDLVAKKREKARRELEGIKSRGLVRLWERNG